jgi:hypothetical protein
MATETRNVRKERTGVVVERRDGQDGGGAGRAPHHASGLWQDLRRSKKYYAHDEKNEAKKGDQVGLPRRVR